jgi:hypothetical protein
MGSPRTEHLAESFLQNAWNLHADVEPIRVLRARAYKIGNANVLIRAASALEGRSRYFFGLNYIHAEEVANLENAFFAFICGADEQTVIIPASVLISHLPVLSHDRNGEYKIIFDSDLNLVLLGRKNTVDCSRYVNSWTQLLSLPVPAGESVSAEDSVHSILQGRLLEIGNIRGFETFCPNKSRKFNGKRLSELSTLAACPKLEWSDYDVLRQIDVLWFKEKGSFHIPECAFEVELTTGTWSGVGRLASLIHYDSVRLYVVSGDKRRYTQVMNSFSEFRARYKHLPTDSIGDLYAAELKLRTQRDQVGL